MWMNSTCMIYWGRPFPGSCSWIWPWSGVDRHWNQGQSDPELAVIWVSTSIWTGLDSTLYSRSALNQGHIWSRSSHYLRAGSQFEPRPSHGMAQHTTPSWKDMVDLQSSHKAEGIMSLFKKCTPQTFLCLLGVWWWWLLSFQVVWCCLQSFADIVVCLNHPTLTLPKCCAMRHKNKRTHRKCVITEKV